MWEFLLQQLVSRSASPVSCPLKQSGVRSHRLGAQSPGALQISGASHKPPGLTWHRSGFPQPPIQVIYLNSTQNSRETGFPVYCKDVTGLQMRDAWGRRLWSFHDSLPAPSFRSLPALQSGNSAPEVLDFHGEFIAYVWLLIDRLGKPCKAWLIRYSVASLCPLFPSMVWLEPSAMRSGYELSDKAR